MPTSHCGRSGCPLPTGRQAQTWTNVTSGRSLAQCLRSPQLFQVFSETPSRLRRWIPPLTAPTSLCPVGDRPLIAMVWRSLDLPTWLTGLPCSTSVSATISRRSLSRRTDRLHKTDLACTPWPPHSDPHSNPSSPSRGKPSEAFGLVSPRSPVTTLPSSSGQQPNQTDQSD